jgi:hypothetical protein
MQITSFVLMDFVQVNLFILYIHLYPTSTRRHGNFAGVHTLLRIILSSNSAVLINIITGVSPPHFDFVVFYYVLCQVHNVHNVHNVHSFIYFQSIDYQRKLRLYKNIVSNPPDTIFTK